MNTILKEHEVIKILRFNQMISLEKLKDEKDISYNRGVSDFASILLLYFDGKISADVLKRYIINYEEKKENF